MLQAILVPILIVSGDEILFANRAAKSLINVGLVDAAGARFAGFTDPAARELFDNVRMRKVHSGTAMVRTEAALFIMQAMRIGMAGPVGEPRPKGDFPIVVFLTQLSGAGGARKSAIEGFALLSKAERAVLIALVNGQSVETIAESTERSIATVRWHVKKMLTKTGARSIGDLTRIGSLLAPY